MGTVTLQTVVRIIQSKPFLTQMYKHGTLLQLLRIKVSREPHLPEVLQYYNPKHYKITKEM